MKKYYLAALALAVFAVVWGCASSSHDSAQKSTKSDDDSAGADDTSNLNQTCLLSVQNLSNYCISDFQDLTGVIGNHWQDYADQECSSGSSAKNCWSLCWNDSYFTNSTHQQDDCNNLYNCLFDCLTS